MGNRFVTPKEEWYMGNIGSRVEKAISDVTKDLHSGWGYCIDTDEEYVELLAHSVGILEDLQGYAKRTHMKTENSLESIHYALAELYEEGEITTLADLVYGIDPTVELLFPEDIIDGDSDSNTMEEK